MYSEKLMPCQAVTSADGTAAIFPIVLVRNAQAQMGSLSRKIAASTPSSGDFFGDVSLFIRMEFAEPGNADLNVASPDACQGAGTDWVAAAFDVTVVSWYTETQGRSPL
jgi:hypothetical protein